MARRLPLADINEHMVCSLCDGYLINATTIVECLHCFCRACIVRYLEINKYCPICEVQVHKTKPLLSIRPDQTFQDIVYKMVPGLYQNEMQRRREFYAEHPEAASGCTPEERGEGDPRFFFPDESISLTLNYRSKDVKTEENPSDPDVVKDATTRYLKCPAAVTISHLKKFIVCKFSLPPAYVIDVFYEDNILRDDLRLMDVAYIYEWRRAEPMEFSYSIKKRVMKVREPQISASTTTTTTAVIPADVEKPVEEKPEVASEEKMEVVEEPHEPVPAVDPAGVSTSTEEKAEPEVEVSVSSSSTNGVQDMDVSETNVSAITSSPTEKPPAVAIAKPTYNSVKFVSAPANALLAPKNGICLKFIHDPELNPKSRSKKSGRKSGRSSRHKSVPKRFARLAPYPSPSVPVTCLPTQPIQHLSQITVGKLVPSVMSSLAPTIVTTLVSTTANSLYNTSQNSMPSSPFLNHPITSNVVSNASNCASEVPASTSNLVAPTSSSSAIPGPLQAVGLTASVASLHIRTDTSTTKDLTNNVVDSIATSKATETLTTAAKDNISKDPSIPVPIKKSQNSDASDISTTVLTISNCSSVAPLTVPVSSVSTTVNSVSSSSENKDDTGNSEIPIKEKEVDTRNVTVENSLSSRDSNGLVDVNNSKPIPPSSKEPNFEGAITEAPELFVQTVRNSISAEFSDNDDLGCQHDLVVDEQRMDEDEDNDVSLRKTINELAKKVDETDDIEGDSGRGSDLSCPARGEEDRDSPAASDIRTSAPSTSSMNSTTTTVTTSTSTDTSNPRYVKSNNIHLVINNLYKHHEIGRTAASSTLSKSSNSDRSSSAKDDSGVLDLSTCTRKDSDAPKPRPKTVANPVLDIKHRQQTYLPAPNKQHTACPPAPKHPTSAMLHQSNSILHSHLTNPKPSHLQVPYNNLPFPIHTGRLVSSPSSLPDRSPPLYSQKMGSASPQSMVGMIPPGILPYTSMMNNLASYAGRNNVNSSLPSRHSSSSSLQKEMPLPSPTAITSKSPYAYKPSSVTAPRKSLDSHMSTSPNSRGLSSPSAAPAHPRTSPSMLRMSPHHRSASPAPSPQQVTPTGNLVASSLAAATSTSQFKPSVPIYKKSDSVSKNHSYKFKGSSNLAVINPDPNGYRQKIVIRNLDFRPNN